jgi:nitrate reductase cytochrome c-type subunit
MEVYAFLIVTALLMPALAVATRVAVIPHSIEGYEISLRANKCLSCHARTRVQESQAPR